MLSKETLTKSLDYYPFEGDFGETSDRTLRDGIVVAAKTHVKSCHICGNDILIETPHRVLVAKWGGTDMAQYRWCYDCCVAMLLYCMDDDGHAMDQRYSIRWGIIQNESN